MGKDFPDPWIPIDSKIELAILGKLQEELSELQAIIARIIIQGVYEKDPDTGIINIKAMEDEMADVDALSNIAAMHFNLSNNNMSIRTQRKMTHIKNWLGLIRNYIR